MNDVLNLLTNYTNNMISTLERILQTIFYFPIFDFYFGYIVIFLLICGFVFHWIQEFLGGDD